MNEAGLGLSGPGLVAMFVRITTKLGTNAGEATKK